MTQSNFETRYTIAKLNDSCFELLHAYKIYVLVGFTQYFYTIIPTYKYVGRKSRPTKVFVKRLNRELVMQNHEYDKKGQKLSKVIFTFYLFTLECY